MAGGLLDWLSNPIGSAIGAIGGVISNAQNAKENQKNREWSEKMWNLNNEYNTPVAQLGRWQDAGISVNPNYLVTGGNAGLSTYSGNLDASRSMENPLKGFNVGFLEAKKLQNETELKDSQKQVNESQTNLNDANAQKASSDAQVNKLTAEFKQTENKYQESQIILDMAHKGLENSALELANNYARDANPIQLNILKETFEKAKADKLISEHTANLILEQIETQKAITERTEAETALTYEKQETERSAQASNYASAGASNAAAGYYGAQTQTENLLRPAQLDKIQAEAENLWRDLRVKDNNIFKTQAEITKLIIDGVVAVENNDRENYVTYVVNKYGNNWAQALINRVDNLAQRHFGYGITDRLRGNSGTTFDNPHRTNVNKKYIPKINPVKKFFKWNKK